MLKKIKLLLLIFMISLFGNNLNANYDELAYDFNFKDCQEIAIFPPVTGG